MSEKEEQYKTGTEIKYIRDMYQNFMVVMETLDKASPMPLTQKKIRQETGLGKNVVLDTFKNLIYRGWAEETGGGAIRLIKTNSENDAYLGRMVRKIVEDNKRNMTD